ncbi:DUF6354 family protein [Streptomyces sp. NPDC059982]
MTVHRDLAPDMKNRDRRLRVVAVGSARAALHVLTTPLP